MQVCSISGARGVSAVAGKRIALVPRKSPQQRLSSNVPIQFGYTNYLFLHGARPLPVSIQDFRDTLAVGTVIPHASHGNVLRSQDKNASHSFHLIEFPTTSERYQYGSSGVS